MVPVGGFTVAVLVMLPVVASTCAVIVYVTTPPLRSVAVVLSGPVPLGAPHAVVTLPVPAVVTAHVQLPIVNPVCTGSVTGALVTSLGPLLVTTTV